MTIEISSDQQKLNISSVQEMLSKVSWSPGITENEIQKGINNSALVVGAYTENDRQIGFLRVVSDKIRFAYFTDVVVHPDFRRNGIGQQMVKFALSHPELKDVYQWLLATADAHGVYAKCGFKPLKEPEKWMAIANPRPDRTIFNG
jgi:GNAT superfamily N-acetyltransferase